MRFKRVELSPANKRQYLIALGRKDIELLLGESLNATSHLPSLPRFKEDRQRLQGISKCLAEALAIAEADGDDGDRVPVEERQKYNDDKVENPLLDITRLEIIDRRPCLSCSPTTRMLCGACGGMGSKGRRVVFWDDKAKVESSVQDDGRTLKLFVDERE